MSKKCKMPNCEAEKKDINNQGGYGKFGIHEMCIRHYDRLVDGFIDIDGVELRPIVRNRLRDKVCVVDGCMADIYIKKSGLCQTHYSKSRIDKRNATVQEYTKKSSQPQVVQVPQVAQVPQPQTILAQCDCDPLSDESIRKVLNYLLEMVS